MSTDTVTGNVERITVSYGTNYLFQLTRHREKLPPVCNSFRRFCIFIG